MSSSTVLGVAPGRRPVELAELRNSHGTGPSVWKRLLVHHGLNERWFLNDTDLNKLWRGIEKAPEWEQAALILTFDTGVIPFQAFDWAAEQLEEFERRLPAPDGHANHVPALAAIFRTCPEVPLIGVWGTSVTGNPFDPWDYDADGPGAGIPLDAMYVLERHRHMVPESQEDPSLRRRSERARQNRIRSIRQVPRLEGFRRVSDAELG